MKKTSSYIFKNAEYAVSPVAMRVVTVKLLIMVKPIDSFSLDLQPQQRYSSFKRRMYLKCKNFSYFSSSFTVSLFK